MSFRNVGILVRKWYGILKLKKTFRKKERSSLIAETAAAVVVAATVALLKKQQRNLHVWGQGCQLVILNSYDLLPYNLWKVVGSLLSTLEYVRNGYHTELILDQLYDEQYWYNYKSTYCLCFSHTKLCWLN